jgi:hypothetical protein
MERAKRALQMRMNVNESAGVFNGSVLKNVSGRKDSIIKNESCRAAIGPFQITPACPGAIIAL